MAPEVIDFPEQTEPIVRRSGDDFVATWPMTYPYLEMRFRGIYEDKQGVHADLGVSINLPTFPRRPEWGRLNLMASSTRAQTAKRLAEQWQGPGSPPFQSALTDACAAVVDLYREGEPFELIAYDQVIEKPEYAIHPLLPKNRITTLFGDGGSGKGLLCCLCSLIVQEGDLLELGDGSQGGTVLYLDYEADRDEQAFRMRRIAEGFGLTSWRELHYRRLFQPLRLEAPTIRRYIDDNKITLVILDSIGAATGANLNDAHEIIGVYATMRSFRCTVLAVDHTSKGDSEGRPTGSNYKYHYSRAIWETKKSAEAGTRELRVALLNHKMNNGGLTLPLGFRFRFDGEAGPITTERFDVRADATLAANTTVTSRILFILKQHPLRFPELLEELKVSTPSLKENTVTQALKRLRDAKRVGTSPDGRYGLLAAQ